MTKIDCINNPPEVNFQIAEEQDSCTTFSNCMVRWWADEYCAFTEILRRGEADFWAISVSLEDGVPEIHVHDDHGNIVGKYQCIETQKP